MAKNPEDWQDYARRLGAIDWLRSAPHWQGILVNNGKMITTQPATKAAVIKVRELIGWSPDLGVPDASLLSDLDLLGSGEETGSGSAGVEPAVSA